MCSALLATPAALPDTYGTCKHVKGFCLYVWRWHTPSWAFAPLEEGRAWRWARFLAAVNDGWRQWCSQPAARQHGAGIAGILATAIIHMYDPLSTAYQIVLLSWLPSAIGSDAPFAVDRSICVCLSQWGTALAVAVTHYDVAETGPCREAAAVSARCCCAYGNPAACTAA